MRFWTRRVGAQMPCARLAPAELSRPRPRTISLGLQYPPPRFVRPRAAAVTSRWLLRVAAHPSPLPSIVSVLGRLRGPPAEQQIQHIIRHADDGPHRNGQSTITQSGGTSQRSRYPYRRRRRNASDVSLTLQHCRRADEADAGCHTLHRAPGIARVGVHHRHGEDGAPNGGNEVGPQTAWALTKLVVKPEKHSSSRGCHEPPDLLPGHMWRFRIRRATR